MDAFATRLMNRCIPSVLPLIACVSFVNPTLGQTRRGDYYYAGVRRIQEVVTTNSPLPGDKVTDREYIYGPEYVDEFIAQLAPGPDGVCPDTVIYTTQDANYNVTGLFDAAGNILHQYTYTPYGRIVAGEEFNPHPINRIGHQGLFFDRFDAPYSSVVLTPETVGLYYNRTRFYDPATGRFPQPDPNETALPILVAAAMNGESFNPDPGLLDVRNLYADGMNLYGYATSNPVSRSDPMGLSSHDFWDNAVDDLIGDLTGQRVGALAAINSSAAAVGLGLNASLSIASSLLGLDLVAAAGRAFTGQGSLADWLEVGLAATGGTYLGYKAFKWIRKFQKGRRFRNAIEKHHLLPVKFAPQFRRAGIRNIDDFVIDLKRASHRLKRKGVHTGSDNWNKRWKQFFKDFESRGVDPQKPDVLKYLGKLRREFGI